MGEDARAGGPECARDREQGVAARIDAAAVLAAIDLDQRAVGGARRAGMRGERRGRVGVVGDQRQRDALLAIARALGPACAGILAHAGHSYACRSIAEVEAVAEAERVAAVTAAARLRQAGIACPIVSVGSTPTSLHARRLDGVTETRPGVYMFQDLFQAQIGSGAIDDVAVTVLASVIGRRPAENRILIDAGALALSKDRSTAAAPHDYGFGLVLDRAGRVRFGEAIVERANQEHGVIAAPTKLPFDALPVGARVRVAPNHVCLAAAAHDRYHVVDGGEEIVAVWPRINGW